MKSKELRHAEMYLRAHIQDLGRQVIQAVRLLDNLHDVDLSKAFEQHSVLNQMHGENGAKLIKLYECLHDARDRADEYSRDYADKVQDQEQRWGGERGAKE